MKVTREIIALHGEKSVNVNRLQDSGGDGITQDNWEQLLDAENPHKLMYSLQIVESLSRPPKFRRNSYAVSVLWIFSVCHLLWVCWHSRSEQHILGFCVIVINYEQNAAYVLNTDRKIANGP